MDLNGQIVFSYIEEDNTQKSFFRVRPLLCLNGLLTEDDIKEYPDDCYLRIVPDRNEQHTFKERMRSLLPFCLINLKDNKQDYSKIRNNKNYAPQRDENNRFIIYSDAVQALVNDFYFDIVSQDDLAQSVTPMAFVRDGGKISGPFDRHTRALSGDEIRIMPDNTDIFTVQLPDGKTRLIYMDRTALNAALASAFEARKASEEQKAAPSPEKAEIKESAVITSDDSAKTTKEEPVSSVPVDAYAQIQEMDQSLQVKTNLLREQRSAPVQATALVSKKDQSSPAKPGRLSGTPLYQAGMRQNNYNGNRNAVIDAVERQRNPGRYDAAGVELGRNTRLQEVSNPIEHFRSILNKAWEWEDSHKQIVGIIMETPGMRAVINQTIGREDTLVTNAMRDQLQEMEADHLMHLVRLEKLKADKEALFEEALKEHQKTLEKECAALEGKKKHLTTDIDQLQKQWDKLIEDRDAVIGEMDESLSDVAYLAASKATAFSFDVLTERIRNTLTNSGFIIDKKLAAALLIALCTDKSITVTSGTLQDAELAGECIANALGARRVNNDRLCVSTLKGGNGFTFTIGSERSVFDCYHIYTAVKGTPLSGADEQNAVFNLKQDLDFIPYATIIAEPACRLSITHAILEKESKLLPNALEMLKKARHDMQPAFNAAMMIRVCRFTAIAQNLLSGGIESALDLAFGIYILPAAINAGISRELLESFAGATPYTMQCISEL